MDFEKELQCLEEPEGSVENWRHLARPSHFSLKPEAHRWRQEGGQDAFLSPQLCFQNYYEENRLYNAFFNPHTNSVKKYYSLYFIYEKIEAQRGWGELFRATQPENGKLGPELKLPLLSPMLFIYPKLCRKMSYNY